MLVKKKNEKNKTPPKNYFSKTKKIFLKKKMFKIIFTFFAILCVFWWRFIKLWSQRVNWLFGGLQAVVPQSTICPSGSRALRSQTWLRKIDARSCVEWLITDYIDAISCVDFAKPCLASQSSWARRANCGLLHYCLEPFNSWSPFLILGSFPILDSLFLSWFPFGSQIVHGVNQTVACWMFFPYGLD